MLLAVAVNATFSLSCWKHKLWHDRIICFHKNNIKWNKASEKNGQQARITQFHGKHVLHTDEQPPRPRLLIIRGKKSQISRDCWGQNHGKIGRFRRNFQGKLGRKAIGKQTADFVVIFRANFARNQSVLRWSDQRFECFSNRGHHLPFQQQYTLEMNQWQSL